MISKKQWSVAVILLSLTLGFTWFLATDNLMIWPVRNALQYRIVSFLNNAFPPSAPNPPGVLRGTVYDEAGRPIAKAWVLVSGPDGTTYSAQSDESGQYMIGEAPAGWYRPVAGAPGYESVRLGDDGWNQVLIKPEGSVVDVVLPIDAAQTVTPGTDFSLGEPKNLSCQAPLPGQGVRRTLHFESNGQANQPSLYYTPVTAEAEAKFPTLLAIYPGPADTWECVSLPLSEAGYAVVAVGPAYSFDLETDLDELERVLAFVRAGKFPGADGDQIALLGGSYSSLHVLRLLQRRQAIQAALLLGPPTDLFDMRRRLENGSFVPPFGLDQAFYALGFPDREPLRYWQYSGAYHVRSDFPPLAILHSRTDAVVPYQQSELLVSQLEAAGVPYESHFFDGGGHYLLAEDGDGDALKMYEITLNFLAKHLR